MRVVVALALLVAVGSVVVAVMALRSADRSREETKQVAARVAEYRVQSARDRAEIRALRQQARAAAVTTKAVAAICFGTRHAEIPRGSDYALQIGASIIGDIAKACDYAHVPDAARAP